MALTWTEIINRFNLQTDQSSELSDAESLALAQEIYQEIQDDRNWIWLRSSFSGTTSTTVPYVSLPSDFKTFSSQYNGGSVVYVGTQPKMYRLISYDDRRNYTDTDGYGYIDIPNLRFVFTKQPTTAETLEFDYIKVAPALTTTTSPLFTQVNEIISYGMAAKFDPIQLTPQWESYQRINQALYLQKLDQLQLIDSKLKLAMS